MIAAVLQLGGGVLDLTDVRLKPLFEVGYASLTLDYKAKGEAVPVNDGNDPDRKRRQLDCVVIGKVCDTLTSASPTQPIDAVRGAFEAGGPMFPGAMLKEQTHIQIAVREPSKVILGVFKPSI